MMVDCQIQGYIKNLKYEGTSQKCQKSKAWVAKVRASTHVWDVGVCAKRL